MLGYVIVIVFTAVIAVFHISNFVKVPKLTFANVKTNQQVNDAASFWRWMKETFVPGMYNNSWYNGRSFEYNEGFIGNRENFLVGMPRLRQVRIRPGEQFCDLSIVILICSLALF